MVNLKSKDDEGFTPLHFASFHGNPDMISILVSYGADVYERNYKGASMMHVAAQGDQPFSLSFFRDKGLELDIADDLGNTPLHWACLLSSFMSIHYLMAFGA